MTSEQLVEIRARCEAIPFGPKTTQEMWTSLRDLLLLADAYEAALEREDELLKLVDAMLAYNRGLISRSLDQRRKDARVKHEEARSA